MKKNDYLKKPYSRILIPDDETGTYTAEILEFPGCIAQGNTVDEAYKNLESAAESWIDAAIGLGQSIPEPSEIQGIGGKIALRLPRSLHRRLLRYAEREGVSLNQFIVSIMAERMGAEELYVNIVNRLLMRNVFEMYPKTAKSGNDNNNIINLHGIEHTAKTDNGH